MSIPRFMEDHTAGVRDAPPPAAAARRTAAWPGPAGREIFSRTTGGAKGAGRGNVNAPLPTAGSSQRRSSAGRRAVPA